MQPKEVTLHLTPYGADLVTRALLLYEATLSMVGEPRLTDVTDVFHIDQITLELGRQVTR